VTSPQPQHEAKAYEERDVTLRPIGIVAVALVVLVIATFGLMRVLDLGLDTREAARSRPASPLAETYGRQEPPSPRLQTDPRRDLAALHAREDAQLKHYGWIDRPSGRVRVPVERAMELLVAEGRK
jgi:hypothetical protein